MWSDVGADSASALLHCADLAMLEAKRAGKNRVVLHRFAPESQTTDD